MTVAQRQIEPMLLAPLLGFLCRSTIFLASRLHHQYQNHLHLVDLFVRLHLRLRVERR